MSSLADDSSLDDNVSSVGEAGWAMVDEEGDNSPSEDDALCFSRILTPASDDEAAESSATLRVPSQPEGLGKEQEHNDPALDEEVLALVTEDSDIRFLSNRKNGNPNKEDMVVPLVDFANKASQDILARSCQPTDQKLLGTARMTISHIPLAMARPLRILYCGNDSAMQPLIEKIAAALLATSDDTSTATPTYLVTPISLDASSHEVTLVPSSNTFVNIQRCVKCARDNAAPIVSQGMTGTQITFDDGHSIKFSWNSLASEHILETDDPAYQLPDIALVHISSRDEHDGPTQSTQALLREFLHQHNVSTIVTVARTDWRGGIPLGRLNEAAPHLCLESRDLRAQDVVLDRFPIDASTFLRIDTLQLNKNLSLLVNRTHSRRSFRRAETCHVSMGITFIKGILMAITALTVVLTFVYSPVWNSRTSVHPASRFGTLSAIPTAITSVATQAAIVPPQPTPCTSSAADRSLSTDALAKDVAKLIFSRMKQYKLSAIQLKTNTSQPNATKKASALSPHLWEALSLFEQSTAIAVRETADFSTFSFHRLSNITSLALAQTREISLVGLNKLHQQRRRARHGRLMYKKAVALAVHTARERLDVIRSTKLSLPYSRDTAVKNIQAWREHNLRLVQKETLKLWWRTFGGPAATDAEVEVARGINA